MEVYLGLGSNMGNRTANLDKAVKAIAGLDDCMVCSLSSIYETEPWGDKNQSAFLNQVMRVETQLEPKAFLSACQRIESKLGRERGRRWGPRTMDIDLLLYGDRVVNEDTIQVPHPQLQKRRFVLVPLAEIAPLVNIPGSGRTVREALKLCPDSGSITLYRNND